jgi:two-component system cell cycle sensor histidine kinase/response regulator CckA
LTDVIQRIADTLPVGVWVARVPTGELVYANQRFREIMGMEARADVGVGEYAEPYGIRDRSGAPYPEDRLPFVQALVTGGPVTVDDLMIHRHDGERVYVRARAAPLRDADGAIEMISIAFEDISREVDAEQRRAETETHLRRAQRMEAVGTLAGGIAHDFNNILASIGILAETLGMTEGDATRRARLERIVDATQDAARLTGALLGYARRGRYHDEPVDLHAVATSVYELLERTLDRQVRVEVRGGSASWVRGDRTQLVQVVMNLALNAAEAMPDGGTVSLRTYTVGAEAILDVEDDGPGIPAELQDRVFEPYFTTKDGTSGGGTGLGLAMVQGIVEAHGGRVEIIDRERGCCLRVHLPTVDAPADAPKPEPGAPSRGAGTLLLIDDDGAVRRALKVGLEELGYNVFEADSGRAGLAVVEDRHHELDAVLLDLVMPGLSGAETFARLKRASPELPVLLCTGFASDADCQELLAQGARGMLRKPLGLRELAGAIARVLPKRAPG